MLPYSLSLAMKRVQFLFNLLRLSPKSLVIRISRQGVSLCGLISVVIVIFLVTILHHLLFKPMVPWTAVEWKDVDFNDSPHREGNGKEIIILRWTKYWQSYWGTSPLLFKAKEKCPGSLNQTLAVDCRVSFDRRYLPRSHAVVFHMWDLVLGMRVGEEMPPYHDPKQIWIYQNQESPDYDPNIGSWMRSTLKGRFNWTMTYRQDSDYYDPYGRVVERCTSYSEKDVDLWLNKTKLVAWIVSHCETPGRREDYVKELRKYIPVDIFGECGNLECKVGSYGECYGDISREYKFYLSFENALCVDYVTEKFFNALAQNIVPVVYGGANYSDIAPPGGFINARKFETPKALANYLLYLDENNDEYLKYFEWKSKFRVVRRVGGDREEDDGRWCGLCQRVHRELRKAKEQSAVSSVGFIKNLYEDVQEWWNFQPSSHDNVREKIPACEKPVMSF